MENKKVIEISATRIFGLLSLIVSFIGLVGIFVVSSSSDGYLTFYTLLILFCVPALVYILACTRSVLRGGIKYLLFREKKISEDIETEGLDEAETERLAIKKKELIRKQKEIYSSSKLKTRWSIVPFLMFFGAGIYVAIIYFSNGNEYNSDGLNSIMVIVGALGLLNIWGLSLQDDWEKKLEIKSEIYRENNDYMFYFGYDDDLVYTDSRFSYVFFVLAKILAYVFGAIGLLILTVTAIAIISNISIAPTTVIIVLLVLIYFKISEKDNP